MARTRPVLTTAAAIVCVIVIGTEWSGPLLASEANPSSRDASASQPAIADTSDAPIPQPLLRTVGAQSWQHTYTLMSESGALGQRGPYGGRGRGRGRGTTAPGTDGRNTAALAIMIGAAVAITGTAVLVYANRPECSLYEPPRSGGCGYGTKVVGGAMLSTGMVGIMVGALTW